MHLRAGNQIKVSVIIPAYNEQLNFRPLITRLLPQLTKFRDYEILFVDDGSSDDSLLELRALHSENQRIQYLALSRNFGHQATLRAGLEHADGDVVISMDADLQHPPEVIPEMVEKWCQGYDVVFTLRTDADTPFMKRISSYMFYRLLNLISSTPVLPGAADFRLIDRRLVDVLKGFRERAIFLRGLIAWLGFKQTSICYNVEPRFSGGSRYNIVKMITLAWDGITSFSIAPLRLSLLIGLVLMVLCFLYGLYILWVFITRPEVIVFGWTSVMFSLITLGGFQLFILGIIGEYLGKLLIEAKSRPFYLVKEKSSTV